MQNTANRISKAPGFESSSTKDEYKNGINPFEKGKTTYRGRPKNDYCNRKETRVREWYCDSKDRRRAKWVKCEYGCEDGKCKKKVEEK